MSLLLAIDGMGGDKAPEMVVDGLALASRRHPGVRFMLFGPQQRLQELVSKHASLQDSVIFLDTDEVVTPEMKPSSAVRSLKRSSMRLAIEAVRDGQAQGVVSAGNTGAYLALSKLILKTLPGIDRPAIVSQIPTSRGESIMLDLGANLICTAENLVDFALMGEAFARHVLHLPHPTVGLLNVGAEDMKGHALLQETASRLKAHSAAFYGFVEGDDISKGTVDVIVTDGFTGNVALKTGEGMIRLLFDAFRLGFASSWVSKLAYFFARPLLRDIKEKFDPRRYNGAIWLGLNGVAVKSHGGTDALGFACAVGMTIEMVESGLNDAIAKAVASFHATVSGEI
ncbi:MAG: phosphate acyltransferase PlsX [Alphaproteobacteria bacterium]